jgi:hypothetical protein
MPELPRIRVFVEGNDDAIIIGCLKTAGLVSERIEVARPSGGVESIPKHVVPFVSPADGAGKTAIVLRDLDDLAPAEPPEWLARGMRGSIAGTETSITIETASDQHSGVIEVRSPSGASASVVVIGAGLPDSSLLASLGVDRFAADDYILHLVTDPRVYASIHEFAVELDHARAMKKLTEMIALLRANGVPVRSSKRLLHLFRAMIGFRAS